MGSTAQMSYAWGCGTDMATGLPLAQFVYPSTFIVFTDSTTASMHHSRFGCACSDVTGYPSGGIRYMNPIHNNGANCGFLDGHAKWLLPYSTAASYFWNYGG
jgi:prepilin-type processing-associated H-X9-DG protein